MGWIADDWAGVDCRGLQLAGCLRYVPLIEGHAMTAVRTHWRQCCKIAANFSWRVYSYLKGGEDGIPTEAASTAQRSTPLPPRRDVPQCLAFDIIVLFRPPFPTYQLLP